MQSYAIGPLEFVEGDLDSARILSYERRCLVEFPLEFLMQHAPTAKFSELITNLNLAPDIHPYLAQWLKHPAIMLVGFTGTSQRIPETSLEPFVDIETLQQPAPSLMLPPGIDIDTLKSAWNDACMPQHCPDCHGTGKYTGLNEIADCETWVVGQFNPVSMLTNLAAGLTEINRHQLEMLWSVSVKCPSMGPQDAV